MSRVNGSLGCPLLFPWASFRVSSPVRPAVSLLNHRRLHHILSILASITKKSMIPVNIIISAKLMSINMTTRSPEVMVARRTPKVPARRLACHLPSPASISRSRRDPRTNHVLRLAKSRYLGTRTRLLLRISRSTGLGLPRL